MDGFINNLDAVLDINKGDEEIEQMEREEFKEAAQLIGCEVIRVEDFEELFDESDIDEDNIDKDTALEIFDRLFYKNHKEVKLLDEGYGRFSELRQVSIYKTFSKNVYSFVAVFDNGYRYMLWCKNDLKHYLEEYRNKLYKDYDEEIVDCFYDDLFEELWH